MRELGSRQDIQEKKKHTEETTEGEIDQAKEHKKELDSTREIWDVMEKPQVTDAVEALRRIADVIERHATSEAERHQAEVTNGIHTEQSDVSEPTREASTTEEEAARDVEARATNTGRYNPEEQQVRRVRLDTHQFLRDIADDSETHQERSKSEIERITQEAKAAAAAVKRF